MNSIAVLDSCPIFAEGLAAVLTAHGMHVTVARSAAEGVSRRADVLVLDPDAVAPVSLVEFLAEASAVAPVLVLARERDERVHTELVRQRVHGVLGRCTDPARLVTAVRTVSGGGRFWDGAVAGTSSDEPDILSPRERQVLRHLASGMTHGQIARVLHISAHTVDSHVKRIRRKLHLGNKAELARAAVLRTPESVSG